MRTKKNSDCNVKMSWNNNYDESALSGIQNTAATKIAAKNIVETAVRNVNRQDDNERMNIYQANIQAGNPLMSTANVAQYRNSWSGGKRTTRSTSKGRRTRSRSRSRKPAARKATANAKKCEWRLTRETVNVIRRKKDGTREKVERSVYKNKKGERRIRRLTKSRGVITASYATFTPVLLKKKKT